MIDAKKCMRGVSNEDAYRDFDATRIYMKILINSSPSYAGYTRACMYSLNLASVVTSFGREHIIKTR